MEEGLTPNEQLQVDMLLLEVYIEQDKLLDAVKLMDTICREDSTVSKSVKDELIATLKEQNELLEARIAQLFAMIKQSKDLNKEG